MSLRELYDNYYTTDREKLWYEINAEDKAANIVRMCGELGAKKVVDIGAGSGAVLRRLAEAGLGEELHAAEISDSGMSELKKLVGGKIAEPRKLDGLRLPYEDDQFDLAILSHVVEHVEHPRMLLHETRRIAKKVYVEVPLEVVPMKRNLRGDWKMDTTGHINYYSQDMIRRLMQTSGWRVLKERVTITSPATYEFMKGKRGLLEYRLKKMLLGLAPGLAQTVFTYHGAVLCERGEMLSLGLEG